ncbi:tetratricopeptide repeat-containing sulfotransferase family protein [Lentisalinibacter orientalis]|uniref:tetratricopeptide repeat-containing sulfotransferase family protein n=1 Tax=Lentisalinibacter orientalis TaxID=2992241 RepID=UPI0038701FCC
MAEGSSSGVAAPRATFHQAIRLLNGGDAEGAIAVCREALAEDPDDINFTALMGAILLKARRLDEAEEQLRRAIALAPSFAKPHEDLGLLLLQQRRNEEAEAVLRRAVTLDPDLEQAHFQLGRALLANGKSDEADEAFERCFALNPEKGRLAEAARLHRSGKVEEAERLYRRVLKDNPKNVTALRLLGVIAMQSGHPENAEELLSKAVRLAPDFTGAIIDLGRLHQDQNRLAEAIECFEKAVETDPRSSHAHFLLAAALAPAARTAAAAAAYRRAIELKPEHAGAWLGLGHTLKTLGRQPEAIEAYRECIRLKPGNGESWWSLANLKTYPLGDEDIQAMEAALQTPDLNEQSEVNFLFALAKAWEDREDYDRAWHYYDRGNRRQRMRENYDPVQTEVNNDAIVEVFTEEFLAVNEGIGCDDPAPIFIVGLPRSGSTLIEQILASHSQVEGTAELPYLGRVATSLNRNRADGVNYPQAVRELKGPNFEALGRRYLEHASLHRVEGLPRFIDKMPNNFPNVGFAHLILPRAKIIDARRHPMDSCLSCYRQLFARGQTFTYDLTEIGEYFLQYQRMMDHWHAVLPGRVLTVQYEELVSDFDSQVRRLIDYCELPWEDACLNFHETDRPVRTASSEQVRQPIYQGAVGFWRRYEQHLDELAGVLEPVLGRYEGYAG